MKRRSAAGRWTPSMKRLPALSIRQPYAWLVANGFKDIENRAHRIHYRGPLLICAARRAKAHRDLRGGLDWDPERGACRVAADPAGESCCKRVRGDS